MIGGIGRIAAAEKMSVEQLQQAYQNKSLPGYIVFPLLEEKMNMQERAENAMAMQAQEQPPISEQIMQKADQARGVEMLPTQFANMAHGGIVAFADGGDAEATDEKHRRGYTSEEDLIRLGASKNSVSSQDIGVLAAQAGVDPVRLSASLSQMSDSEKRDLMYALAVRAEANVGDLNLGAQYSRQLDAPTGIYSIGADASYPVGAGRLQGSIMQNRSPYGTQDVYNIGYGGKVGPGYLNVGASLPRGQRPMAQASYNIPFAEGGKVERYQNKGLIPSNAIPFSGIRTKEQAQAVLDQAMTLAQDPNASDKERARAQTTVEQLNAVLADMQATSRAGATPTAGIAALPIPQDVPGTVVDTGAGEADVSVPTSGMMGGDSNPYEQYIDRIRAMTRGSREMSQAEKDYANRVAVSEKDKERAMWMRALQASIGALGGTSRFAGANIAAGINPALQGYMQDIKSQKELETKALGEKAAIAKGERLADIQDVYKGLDLYGKEQDLKYKLGTLAKPTDYERRYQNYLPQVMAELGINDPNDPRVRSATAEKVDKSIGYAAGRADIAAATADQVRRQQASIRATDSVSQRLDRKSSHPDALQYRMILKKDGPQAAEAYRESLYEQEYSRQLAALGTAGLPPPPPLQPPPSQPQPSQSEPAQSLPPEAIKSLKFGEATIFKNGEKWTLDESGKPKKVSQ